MGALGCESSKKGYRQGALDNGQVLFLRHLMPCIPSAPGYNLVKNSRGWIRGQNQARPPPFQALLHSEVRAENGVVWEVSSWRTLRRWAGDEDLVERSG